MTDSLKIGKRAFTVAVAAATILWSIGISAFVAPMSARAASSGDLIKGETLSTVYYYGSDGSRYAFPNEKSYFTWYSDFSDVETITDSELAAISLAGNVVYRPGSRWVKIQSDPKTYVVSTEGTVRWVESEEVAEGLAGSDWNTMIDDVPDTFFVDYTVGTSLTDAGDAFDGALVDVDGATYLVWDGEMRLVSDAGFSANMFQTRNVLDGDGMDLAGLDAGDEVTEELSALTDSVQLGEEVTGGLSVSLASDTAASATIPSGAASVGFTKVKLMASSGSADVSQMVFRLGGIGSVDNIENAFLYEGSMRLTDARSVNSSTRNVTFSGLDISLDSGDSTYVTVRVDILDDGDVGSGDTASFALVDEDSVTSSATVSGSFPISGNTMTFSTTEAGTITIDKNGTVSDPVIGEEGAEIAEFDATAANEDAWLSEITLNVDDAGDHSNYELWNGNDLVASGTQSDDLVSFELADSIYIEEGETEDFTLTADIGGESGDTIGVAVEEEADVVAIGGDYGFNLEVSILDTYDETGSACAASTDECSFSTIQGGELTFAFNGPSADDIQIDGEDQDLLDFTITADNWVEVQELAIIFADNGGAGNDDDDDDDQDLKQDDSETNLTDLVIREEDGSAWMGPEELSGTDASSDTTQTITFTDDQILQSGESIDLMVTVDVDSGAVAGEIYTATIDMSLVVAEDSNGDELAADDIVPSADITGRDFTLVDSSLDVDASSPPSDGDYVKGSTGVDVSGYNFEAGDASDVSVTDITYTVEGDNDGTYSSEDDIDVGDHLSSCSLYDSESGSLVDGPESPDSDDEIDFEDFEWTVEAGETSKLLLTCNFSNTDTLDSDDAGTVVDDDAYAFFIAADADITAEDADGDNVDADIGTNNDDGDVTTVTITGAGSIAVTLSGSTANSTIILGASTDVDVAKFKFAATDEPFTLETLTVLNGGDDDVAASLMLSCENEAGETVTKTGFLSGGSASFSNLECYVDTESTETISFTVDTNTVSSTSAASGSTFDLTLDADATGFEAIGAASGETVTDAGTDVAANEMVLRKTKPTFSLASGSPSGAGVAGNSEVLRFNVAADSRGFVTLEQVLFDVNTSNDGLADDWLDCDVTDLGVATKWELYDADDSSEKLDDAGDWTFLKSDGTACGVDDDLAWAELDFEGPGGATSDEEIGAGETKTYVLKVDTTGASSSNDDSIRIDIPDESTADDVALDAIRWDDDDTVEGVNATGTYVKNLPVTGGTTQY